MQDIAVATCLQEIDLYTFFFTSRVHTALPTGPIVSYLAYVCVSSLSVGGVVVCHSLLHMRNYVITMHGQCNIGGVSWQPFILLQ